MGGTARPIAALSSGLLARKGQARPAMRLPDFGDLRAPAPADDLGWNDMGAGSDDLPPVLVARAALGDEVARIAPATTPAAPAAAAEPEPEPEPAPQPDPAVIEQVARDPARPGKAAFTLRLPADRHLRLRLAAAVTRRSAQAIVTEALDAFLAALPEVEDLARRCAAPADPAALQSGNRP